MADPWERGRPARPGRSRDPRAVIPAQAGIQVFGERRVLAEAGVLPAMTSIRAFRHAGGTPAFPGGGTPAFPGYMDPRLRGDDEGGRDARVPTGHAVPRKGTNLIHHSRAPWGGTIFPPRLAISMASATSGGM